MTGRPDIIVSTLDAERLERLLASLTPAAFPGKDALEDELARATIVPPHNVPPNVVTMNSTVRFRVNGAAEEFTLKLVYPQDSGKGEDRISILAPVGTALLGLAQGDEIDWPRPGKGTVRVRIEEVTRQPEREGDFAS